MPSNLNNILIHPPYFGSIAQYVAIAKASGKVIFENCDNYQKQTHRNRTYIYGANGALVLNLSILHTKKGVKQLYRDVLLEHQFNTLQIHWKSLESAYRTSPYFEFYEDELAPIFEGKPKYIMDFNYKCLEFITDAIQLDLDYFKTKSYLEIPENTIDYRNLSNPKDKTIGANFSPYIQVFDSKHGFIPNLSILDLLFNQGPNSLNYLENQKI